MSEWKTGALREACNISTGFAFKGDQYESSGNLRVVRGENVTVGTLKWDSEKHWNHSLAGLDNYLLAANDIVIGMDGSRVGQNRAKVRAVDLPLILAQRVARLRAKEGFNQDFIWYQIIDDRFKDYVEAIHTGTSIPHISMNQIGDYKVTLPPLSEQKAIASVLSSLDDKIDLLHRQNKTLEAMAETLFRQWFVEEVEDDWKEGTISDLIEFNPARKLAKGKIAPYLEMAALSTNTFNPDGWYPREFSSGTKFINGDTLLARITPCLENGKTAYITFLEDEQVAWGSTEYIVMRPKGNLHPFFAYSLARNSDFRDYAEGCLAGSSGRQRIDVDHLKDYKISIPSATRIKNYNAFAESITPKLHANSQQIRTLETLRDTLLPKLMSGEVRVDYP